MSSQSGRSPEPLGPTASSPLMQGLPEEEK
jgi:hypothetical protein